MPAHLIRLQWQTQGRATASMADATRLRAALDELEAEAEARVLRAKLAKAEMDLSSFRHTLRYRLACRMAAPLDRLRDLRGARR